MSKRYLLTGVQLRTLRMLPQDKIRDYLDEIEDKQFLFNSENEISIDVKKVIKYLED